jgi:hypothetical protein
MIIQDYFVKLIIKTYLLILLYLLTSIASAESSIKDKDKIDTSHAAPDIQKFQAYKNTLKSLGYQDLRITGFVDTKNSPSSFTQLLSKPKSGNANDPIYAAVIISDGKGEAQIIFNNFIRCTPTQPGKLVDNFIYVNGQKVATRFSCFKKEGELNSSGYMLKSKEAQEFVRKEFAGKKFVFVKFESFEVPFFTSGFDSLWAEAIEPAL